MTDSPAPDITQLLRRMGDGEPGAAEQLLPLLYAELRALAEAQLRGSRNARTLQPTALLHEAYLKVARCEGGLWDGRKQFFTVAARAMRSVIIDHARKRAAERRGAGLRPGTLADITIAEAAEPESLIDLDGALTRFEAVDPQRAKLVDLLFFAGLSTAEAAEVLGVSQRTVERGWNTARAWLFRELSKA